MNNPMKRTRVADTASDAGIVARLLWYTDFTKLKPGTRFPSERELAEFVTHKSGVRARGLSRSGLVAGGRSPFQFGHLPE